MDTAAELRESLPCLACGAGEIEYETRPCRHAALCKKCAMMMATGGRCKVCQQLFVSRKRVEVGQAQEASDDSDSSAD